MRSSLLWFTTAAWCVVLPGCNVVEDLVSAATPLPAWWLAMHGTARDVFLEGAGERIEIPNLDRAPRAAAARVYASECLPCHGAPGRIPGPWAAMQPPPPLLADPPEGRGTYREPGELYWVIKNGVSQTGMPPFGPFYNDHLLWGLTGVVEELPWMSPEEFKELVEDASPSGAVDGDSPPTVE